MKIANAAQTVLLLTGAIFFGCEREHSTSVEHRPRKQEITDTGDSDPTMQAAINEARASVDSFIKVLARPRRTQSEFSVRVVIREGQMAEHLWLSKVHYYSGKFYGTVNNPDKLTTVKAGDDAEVKKDEISDWMYVEDGRLVGGYTIRALLDAMPEKERREQEEKLTYKID